MRNLVQRTRGRTPNVRASRAIQRQARQNANGIAYEG